MKRASFFLPEDLIDRLAAESKRTGVPVAEMVRRSLEATTPPVTVGFGELRKFLDRQGLLKVLVLSAREGKFLVEPGGDMFGVQIWVDADLVRFDDQPTALLPSVGETVEQSVRLNLATDEASKSEEPKA